jgi:hypothetical protein
MPLWALAFPFAATRLRQPRRVIAPLAAIGLLVQLGGISIDSHRFFYELNLPAFAWETDPWFYFKHSQLAACPAELLASLRDGSPADPARFDASATGRLIYRLYGIRNPALSRVWMGDNFQLYYFPRPWWGWIGPAPPGARPSDPVWLMAWCAALLALGGALVARSQQAGDPEFAQPRSRGEDPGSALPRSLGSGRVETDRVGAGPDLSGGKVG